MNTFEEEVFNRKVVDCWSKKANKQQTFHCDSFYQNWFTCACFFFNKGWIKKTLLRNLKNYATVLKVLKNPKILFAFM